jgi:hypothetical protein
MNSGARLAKDRRRIVDELAGMRLDAQIDAALRIGSGRALRNRNDCIVPAFRG